MKWLRFAPLTLVLVLAGCKPAATPNTSKAVELTPEYVELMKKGTTGNTSTDQAAPSTGDPQADFITAFKTASETKDIEQMLQLYCFDGVDAEMRDVVRGNVTDELRQPVTELKIVDAEPGKHGSKTEGEIRWKPNLTVSKVLKVKFAPAAPGSDFAISEAEYPLGVKDGQYRIVMSVRE